ncbi:Phosphopantothenoylcysteine decarboxylase [Planctomycetes bacterium Pan216]|uniref:Phosphopantothenoylcysteine decarboxylase n=1 Tax=Kolteria novifilia TaxID=2527975 RepID=A0A518B575_9BACT|nr:Phosphopantothenoylcysteine decarboxylase [Planctomycetes bacterium Pan216]
MGKTASPPNILWGVTGSVAAIRADRLASSLGELGRLRVVVTDRAKHFRPAFPREVDVHDDEGEWREWEQLGDPVLHIELRKWADLFVIAPLSANTLAKITAGIADNLLLSVARAWNYRVPFVVAPAMNTMMWDHPVTCRSLELFRSWGGHVVEPIEKELACGDVGVGALAEADTIAAKVRELLPRKG